MHVLSSFIRKYSTTVAQSLYVFDHAVSPILCYGAEVWGFEKSETIERVQYKFCRKILRVRSNATNAGALGEVGRYP
jgi:hypothetical protein